MGLRDDLRYLPFGLTLPQLIAVLLLCFVCEHAPLKLMTLTPMVLQSAPGMSRTPTGTDEFWAVMDLQDRLDDLGWTVTYEPILDKGVLGLTSNDDHHVTIEETLDWNARYSVLTHEAGHTQQPGWMNEHQGEIFAESVSALLTSSRELPAHAKYLSRFKPEFFMMAVIEWPDIYRAAAQLEN